MADMPRGRFITFEGPEGSGKSTQIGRLAARLRAKGLLVLCTREPGGTPTGELIRDILQHNGSGEGISPRAELLLFEASRAQLVSHVILPALKAGQWVLCDRFMDSTTAYQGYARGFPIDSVGAINAFAVGEAQPELTLLLDLPVKTGFERLQIRNAGAEGDRFEREALDFHERVRAGYQAIAARSPERFRIVDAQATPETVEQSIWEHLQDVFRPAI